VLGPGRLGRRRPGWLGWRRRIGRGRLGDGLRRSVALVVGRLLRRRVVTGLGLAKVERCQALPRLVGRGI